MATTTVTIAGKSRNVGMSITSYASLQDATTIAFSYLPDGAKFVNNTYTPGLQESTLSYTMLDATGQGSLKSFIVTVEQENQAAILNTGFSDNNLRQNAIYFGKEKLQILKEAYAGFLRLQQGKELLPVTTSDATSEGVNVVSTDQPVVASIKQQATQLITSIPQAPLKAVTSVASNGLNAITQAVSKGLVTQQEANTLINDLSEFANTDPTAAASAAIAHHDFVTSNASLVTRSLNATVQPDKVNSPNRCSSIGDYLGSLQGKFTSTLSSLFSNLTSFVKGILSVPQQIFSAVNSAIGAVVGAITSGIKSVVGFAVAGLKTAFGAVKTALGPISNLAGKVSSGISSLASGIASEATKIKSAISTFISNTFNITLPNASPCLKDAISNNSNATQVKSIGLDNFVVL